MQRRAPNEDNVLARGERDRAVDGDEGEIVAPRRTHCTNQAIGADVNHPGRIVRSSAHEEISSERIDTQIFGNPGKLDVLTDLFTIAVDHVDLMRGVRQDEKPIAARRRDERARVPFELDDVERSQITRSDADQVVLDGEVEAVTCLSPGGTCGARNFRRVEDLRVGRTQPPHGRRMLLARDQEKRSIDEWYGRPRRPWRLERPVTAWRRSQQRPVLR